VCVDEPVPDILYSQQDRVAPMFSSILAAAAAAAAVLQLCCLSPGSNLVCLNYMEHTVQMLQAPSSMADAWASSQFCFGKTEAMCLVAGPAGRSGTPLGLFSRPGSGAELFADATATSAASHRSAASRRGHVSRHPSGADVLAGANTPGHSDRSGVNTKALSRHVSCEVLVPGTSNPGTAGRRGILSRHPSGNNALADATVTGMFNKGGVLRGAMSRHASAEGLTPAVPNMKPYSSSAVSSRPAASDSGAASDRQRSAAGADAASAEGVAEAAERKGSASVSNSAEEQQSSHSVKTGSQSQQHNNQPFDSLNVTEETVMLPSLVEPLVRLPTHKSALKSAASLYAASGVVDDLFTPKETYVNGGAEPMTRARHHYGLSPRQIEGDSEKRKEFASNLGAWYKAQLQRRARVNTSGARVMSRSNSKLSD